MKYYLRSIREDGFGECVLPTEKFGRADHWNIESEMEHNNAYEAFMEYISSLPVSALAHPDLAKKIGWVENAEEQYQRYIDGPDKWYKCEKIEYDAIAWQLHPTHRRILLVEKKQEQDMISNRIVWGKDERFKKPTDEQLINFALVFNDGKIEPEKLADMVSMTTMIVDRLYENGDILIPSSKEKDNG